MFVVREVGLRFSTLILNCHFVIKFSGQLLTSQGPQILLPAVYHQENLPRVSIFRDSPVFGAAEVVNVAALEDLLVGSNHDFLCSFGAQDVN